MSNLQSKMSAVKFEPIPERPARAPGNGLLVLGVIYPGLVIAFELLTRWCTQAFFDPMPTPWHALAVGFVPACNLMVWIHLRNGSARHVKWLAFANGAAIAVAAFYALVFLPLLPLALVAIIVLIGVLPLAPVAAFACALNLLAAIRAAHKDRQLNRALLGGLVAGLAALLALDLPPAATRLGIQWATSRVPAERERGLTLLRHWGDDDLLLRLCYGAAGRPTGLLSALVLFSADGWLAFGRSQLTQTPAQAREIYYRVHGVPFNARPAPVANDARFADFQLDEDHGGTQVGGRLLGLSLVSSRIDGSINSDDAVAYLEWTFEYHNSSLIDREARLQLALPPGGVVSRATLWVDGEEREAAYGGRGELRAAYQRVAVQQRRDPLLVTTKGADRVLAQAFPVPRNGGSIKLKIGISAPLEIRDPAAARLVLPGLVDRNFSFAPDLRHSVWIESKQPLSAAAPGLTAQRVDAGLFRIAGTLGDRDLSGTRQPVMVDRNPDIGGGREARIGEGEIVLQDVARSDPPASASLLLVIDGSARLADKTESLIQALDAIPPGVKVGAIIAAEPMQRVAPAPWSSLQKQSLVRLLRSTSFFGGQDNAPALIEAMQMLEAEPHATLLWVHGPQPVSFHESAAQLEQATARLSRLPQVILYGIEPGPNELLPDAPWVWGAGSLPQTGAPAADLSDFFVRSLSQTQTLIRRTQGASTEGLSKGSDHIARLWANDRVLALMRADPIRNRAAAVALAAEYRLVTPVSAAVVLATQQQYDESRLTPVSQATVPTIPEPHEWALALIACAALAWLVWRNRLRTVAAA
ncbi:MAG TPA: hypothetical protein VIY51_07080 [Xanthobacteraceae bacterium]